VSLNKISRREALQKIVLGIGSVAVSPPSLISRQSHVSQPQNLDHLLIQDKLNFDANPRIFFNNKSTAFINILPKPGRNLEVELYASQLDAHITSSQFVTRRIDVKDSIDIPFYFWPDQEIKYQLRWRNYDEKHSKWRASPEYTVKTPYVDLDRGDEVVLILWADDHATADDADTKERILVDEKLKQDRITGDCFNNFMREFIENPDYKPEPNSEEAKLMNAWCSARAQYEIAVRERPHVIINMGDTNPFGFGYKWEGLGLSDHNYATREEIESYGELFFRSVRKKFSATSPFIPTYFVNGNHDAKQGFQSTLRDVAIRKGAKYLRQPHWGQDAHEQNYFPLFFGPNKDIIPVRDKLPEEDVMLMILDGESYNSQKPERPEDFTLGDKQMYDLKNLLQQSEGVKYKLYCIHRLVGGYFGGPDGNLTEAAYARGLLATKDDYEELKKIGKKLGLSCQPQNVEQVELTKLFMKYNISREDFLIIGHDHIYANRHVQDENGQLYLMCAGSLKHKGEIKWYDGEHSTLWKHFYGNFGIYHKDDRISGNGEPDFWSPSGYVRLTISREGIFSEYVRAADNYPLTNMPLDYEVGDVLPEIVFTEFPSRLDLDTVI